MGRILLAILLLAVLAGMGVSCNQVTQVAVDNVKTRLGEALTPID